MVQTIYNLDAGWEGLDINTKWKYLQEDSDGNVDLEEFNTGSAIKIKIQVSAAQLATNFSVYTWQWTPAGGETAYYFDEEGEVQSMQGDLITAKMITLGNFFKTSDEALAAAKRIVSNMSSYHDTLGY